MSLRENRQEVEVQVEFNLEHLDDDTPIRIGGPLVDTLSQNLRTLAGCALLVDGDTDGFYAALTRSGHVRTHFLGRRAADPAARNSYFATGNAAAFFDVLAGHNFELGARIAALSPTEYWKGDEYEEDFCFAFFFHLLIRPDSPRDAMARTLERFAAAIETEEDPKLLVCRALFAADQEGFDESFSALLDARKEYLAEQKTRFWPDGQIGYRVISRIYIEALAILNMAGRLGLKTDGEYRYCPPLARLPPSRPFPSGVFDGAAPREDR